MESDVLQDQICNLLKSISPHTAEVGYLVANVYLPKSRMPIAEWNAAKRRVAAVLGILRRNGKVDALYGQNTTWFAK